MVLFDFSSAATQSSSSGSAGSNHHIVVISGAPLSGPGDLYEVYFRAPGLFALGLSRQVHLGPRATAPATKGFDRPLQRPRSLCHQSAGRRLPTCARARSSRFPVQVLSHVDSRRSSGVCLVSLGCNQSERFDKKLQGQTHTQTSIAGYSIGGEDGAIRG